MIAHLSKPGVTLGAVDWGNVPTGCNVYLFNAINPDLLSFENPFTGNLKVKLAATGETGINPALIAGRQGDFFASVDPVNEPVWVQYEIEASSLNSLVDATYSGVVGLVGLDDVFYKIDNDNLGGGLIIENVQPDQWQKGACVPAWDDSPNIYVNTIFAGGDNSADAGVIGTAPDAHNFDFASVDFTNNRDGTLLFNSDFTNGRRSLSYQIDANNTNLELGQRYRISYDATNLVGGDTGTVLSAQGASDVEIHATRTGVPFGETRTVFIEFTPLVPGWALRARVGTGPTTNTTNSVMVTDPQLRRV